jgi:steroid 5-alpha reductase family enzyme
MELFIVLIILLLLGILIAVPIQVAAKRAENDRQLILSVSAQVVAKRPLTHR